MNSEARPTPSLRDMELEVEAERREWRRRLEAKLQTQADKDGGGFSPQWTESTPPAAGLVVKPSGANRTTLRGTLPG